MHGNVLNEFGKHFTTSDEISFAVYLDYDADATVVVVGADDTSASLALTALVGFGQTFFAHGFKGFIKITTNFIKSGFSVRQPDAGQIF